MDLPGQKRPNFLCMQALEGQKRPLRMAVAPSFTPVTSLCSDKTAKENVITRCSTWYWCFASLLLSAFSELGTVGSMFVCVHRHVNVYQIPSGFVRAVYDLCVSFYVESEKPARQPPCGAKL